MARPMASDADNEFSLRDGRTARETSTSPEAASSETREPMWTAIPPRSRSCSLTDGTEEGIRLRVSAVVLLRKARDPTLADDSREGTDGARHRRGELRRSQRRFRAKRVSRDVRLAHGDPCVPGDRSTQLLLDHGLTD